MVAFREVRLQSRHKRIRKHVLGTAERPRLSVHRSHLNLNAQIIDDYESKTLLSFSTLSSEFRQKAAKNKTGNFGNLESTREFGKMLAEKLKKQGILKVVFDRGGFLYHGRVKALADVLRESGIIF